MYILPPPPAPSPSRFTLYLRPVLGSRSVFDQLRFFFSQAQVFFCRLRLPTPAAIKSRLLTIKIFFLQHPTFLTKNNLILSICFLNTGSLYQCGNERREYHKEFVLFYLRWSQSRTFTLAPAPTKIFRLRPVPAPQHCLRLTLWSLPTTIFAVDKIFPRFFFHHFFLELHSFLSRKR